MGLCGTDRGEKNNLAVCVFVINIKLPRRFGFDFIRDDDDDGDGQDARERCGSLVGSGTS